MPVFRGSKKAAIEATMISHFVAGVREYYWSVLTGETSGLKLPLKGRMGCNGWERRDSLGRKESKTPAQQDSMHHRLWEPCLAQNR